MQSKRQLAERTPTLCRNDRPDPEPATNRQHQDTGSPFFDGEPDSLASMDWSRRTFPAVRRITVRWKLDLILLNPPNHISSIPAAGVNFGQILRHPRAKG